MMQAWAQVERKMLFLEIPEAPQFFLQTVKNKAITIRKNERKLVKSTCYVSDSSEVMRT